MESRIGKQSNTYLSCESDGRETEEKEEKDRACTKDVYQDWKEAILPEFKEQSSFPESYLSAFAPPKSQLTSTIHKTDDHNSEQSSRLPGGTGGVSKVSAKNFSNSSKLQVHSNFPNVDSLNSLQSGETFPDTLYDLRAVVVHQGGAHSGHYITYRLVEDCKAEENRNVWVRASDEDVSEVDESVVLSAEAYLLFYEQCQMVTKLCQ